MNRQYHFIQNSGDFHKKRAKTVGSSDIPVLMGIVKQKTTYQLWKEKTGREFNKFTGNTATSLGHAMEGIILSREIEDIAGADIAREFKTDYYHHEKERQKDWNPKTPFIPFAFFMHPENRQLTASPDVFAFQNRANYLEFDQIIEAKLGSRFANLRSKQNQEGYDPEDQTENGLPVRVYSQCQWQSLVSGIKNITVRALIDSIIEARFDFKANLEHQNGLRELAERFLWHVNKDQQPAPSNQSDIFDIYDNVKNEVLIIGGEKADQAKLIKAEKDKWQKVEKEAKENIQDSKNALAILLGEYKYLETANGEKIATQVIQKPSWSNIGVAKIEKECPEGFNLLKKSGLIPEKKIKRFIR